MCTLAIFPLSNPSHVRNRWALFSPKSLYFLVMGYFHVYKHLILFVFNRYEIQTHMFPQYLSLAICFRAEEQYGSS